MFLGRLPCSTLTFDFPSVWCGSRPFNLRQCRTQKLQDCLFRPPPPRGLPGSSALGSISLRFSTFSIFPNLLVVKFELPNSKAARLTILELLGRLRGRFPTPGSPREPLVGSLWEPLGKLEFVYFSSKYIRKVVYPGPGVPQTILIPILWGLVAWGL